MNTINQNSNKKKYPSILYVYLLFYLSSLSWSSTFLYFFHLKAALMYYPIIIILFLVFIRKYKIHKLVLISILAFSSTFLIIGFIADIHLYIIRYSFLSIIFFVLYIYVYKLNVLVVRSIEFTSYFLIIAIILSIISFIYVYLGGEPLYQFPNPDGRINNLYLFSFSNTINYNIIRPSFIYDEPGAFSFLIISTVILREIYGLKKNITIFILVFGLITLSLSHVIFTFLYFLLRTNFKQKIASGLLLMILLSLVIDIPAMNFFFDRFHIDNSGRIKGDNRSGQIENFYNIVTPKIILLGNNNLNIKANGRKNDISSSFVTPLYRGGIMVLLVQCLTYSMLILLIFLRKEFLFPSLALMLLFSERPYFGEIGYQIFLYISILSMYYKVSLKGKNIENNNCNNSLQ